MRNILSEFLSNRKATADDKKKQAAAIRYAIMTDGGVAKRLLGNPDFIRFCVLLSEDREALNDNLLKDDPKAPKTHDQNVRLIARINQIDKVLAKARSMIWQMENLTEVRAAMQEKTHAVQDRGNKTGGRNE